MSNTNIPAFDPALMPDRTQFPAPMRQAQLQLKPDGTPKDNRLKNVAGVTAKDRFDIDPRLIRIEPGHNPRDFTLADARADLDALKESIRLYGVLNPPWVRYEASTHEPVLVAGERRLRAVLELVTEGHPIESIPVVQVVANDPEQRKILATMENMERRDLTQWEEGRNFRQFEQQFGWSIERIAKQFGKTFTYIRGAMELSDSPPAVNRLLKEDSVTPAAARAAVKQHGSKAADVLLAELQSAQAATPAVGGKPSKPVKIKRKLEPGTVTKATQVGIFEKALRDVYADLGKASERTIKQRIKDAFENAGVPWS